MSASYDKHLDTLLDAEARALCSAPDQAGAPVDDVFCFRAAEPPIAAVADRFVEVLKVLNAHASDIPADADGLIKEEDFTRLDAAWRPLFPDWLTQPMAVLPPTDAQARDPDFQRRVIFARWLSQFARAHRYCFYACHELSEDRLRISVSYSEHPAPSFAFTDLVEKCGGVQAQDGSDPISGRVLGMLRNAMSRKKR